MILKAVVETYSTDDPHGKGRVCLRSPGVWDYFEDTPDDVKNYYPTVNNLPLKKGDVVWVYCEGDDFSNPLVLGKVRDNSWKTNATGNGHVIWETEDNDGNWSVLYTTGETTVLENSSGLKVNVDGGFVSVGAGNYEPAVLGDTLVDLLGELCDTISALKTVDMKGVEPLTKSKLSVLKGKFEQVKSNVVEIE